MRKPFPTCNSRRQQTCTCATTKGGERYATTVGGPITGKGADYIIVDDPMKFQDVDSETRRDDVANWVSNLATRLNNPNTGGILLIAQRLHQDDVIGRIAEKGGWEIVNLPLVATQDELHERGPNRLYERKAGEYLHPARIDKVLAQQLRDQLGNSAFQAQYQQNPLPAGADFFDLELIKRYKNPPKGFEHIFFSVDVATVADGGDYSVCTIWGYVDLFARCVAQAGQLPGAAEGYHRARQKVRAELDHCRGYRQWRSPLRGFTQ
jgi:hypothetical protein